MHKWIVAVVVVASGCLSTAQVKRLNTPMETDSIQGFPGIPFYVKRGVCRETVAYLAPVTVARLVIAQRLGATEEIVFDDVRIVTRKETDPTGTLHELKALVGKFNAPIGQVIQPGQPGAVTHPGVSLDTLIRYFQSIPEEHSKRPNQAAPAGMILAAHDVRLEVVTDYSIQFTLNAQRPWIGNSTVEATIAEDGTLSVGKSVQEDRLAETVLSAAAPAIDRLFSEDDDVAAASKAVEEASDLMGMFREQQSATAQRLPVWRAQLTLRPLDIVHTLSTVSQPDSSVCALEPLGTKTFEDWEYRRSVAGVAPGDKDKKPDADADPKADGTKPKNDAN